MAGITPHDGMHHAIDSALNEFCNLGFRSFMAARLSGTLLDGRARQVVSLSSYAPDSEATERSRNARLLTATLRLLDGRPLASLTKPRTTPDFPCCYASGFAASSISGKFSPQLSKLGAAPNLRGGLAAELRVRCLTTLRHVVAMPVSAFLLDELSFEHVRFSIILSSGDRHHSEITITVLTHCRMQKMRATV